MKWTPGRWVSPGLGLSGAAVVAPGALGRVLARLAVASLAIAAIAAIVLLWPDSPSPPSPPPVDLSSRPAPEPGQAASEPPSASESSPGPAPVPETGVETEVTPSEAPSAATPSEPSQPEVEATPQPVYERIHEHVYEFDYRGALLTSFGALLAVALAFIRLPLNRSTLVTVAVVSALALWFGIDFVYAGQFPEVFDYRESFFEDEVRHVVTHFDHSHPVIVQVPLAIVGAGAFAWSLLGSVQLVRRARERGGNLFATRRS